MDVDDFLERFLVIVGGEGGFLLIVLCFVLLLFVVLSYPYLQ